MDKLSSVDELLQKIELRPPDSNSWMVLVAIHDDIQSTTDDKQGHDKIFGGGKNFGRIQDIPHFKLHNGCWFDFAITIDQNRKVEQITAFNFEIRFPKREEEIAVLFLRIDLNLPDHNNDERNIRFHLHPSNDGIMTHSPPMSPLEILHMFLYGMNIRNKPRSS